MSESRGHHQMTTTPVLEALKQCKQFLEDMHTQPPSWTVNESVTLHGKVCDALRAANAKPDQVDATAQEPLTFDIAPCEGEQGRTGYRVWMRRGGASRVVFATHHEPSAKHELAKLQRMFGDAAVPQPAQAQQEPAAWPLEPTDEMQLAGAQAIRFDTTPLNKIWTANAVYRAMRAVAPAAQPVQPITDEREAFERWCLTQGWVTAPAKRDNETYVNGQVQSKWLAWQARASLRSPHPEVREQAPEKVGRQG